MKPPATHCNEGRRHLGSGEHDQGREPDVVIACSGDIPTQELLAVDATDRVPKLRAVGAHSKEKFRNEQISCRQYAHEHGIGKPEVVGWR